MRIFSRYAVAIAAIQPQIPSMLFLLLAHTPRTRTLHSSRSNGIGNFELSGGRLVVKQKT